MQYSILKYGHLMLTDVEDLEQTKKEALALVVPKRSDFVEIRDSSNETITIGYFDGSQFHWTRDKVQTEAWTKGWRTDQGLPGSLGISLYQCGIL